MAASVEPSTIAEPSVPNIAPAVASEQAEAFPANASADISLEPGLAYGINGDIFVADRDGTNPVRIADGVPADGADECSAGEHRAENIAIGSAWSPDGRHLAYWDWGCPTRPDAWGTAIISDPEGNVVASFPGQGWLISWSPDSTQVATWKSWAPGTAFTNPGGNPTIGVYGLDGVLQQALEVPPGLMPSGDTSPVWSRDGESLLLPGVQVPLDGRAPRRLPAGDLTGTAAHSIRSAAYSPDGSLVAYASWPRSVKTGSPRGQLVVAEADGPDAQKVAGTNEFWDAAWSPRGDKVAFIHRDHELRVRDLTTRTVTSLTGKGSSELLRVIEFSPDGERILFSKFGGRDTGTSSLWSIGSDGSKPRRLVTDIDWADWRPPSPQR